MDLSIIDRALRLRDEARKAQLGDNAPDISPLGRGENGRMEQPTGLPDDEIAVELMGRALELFSAVETENDPESTPRPDPQSQIDIAELLAAATAPLPMFDEAALAGIDTPPNMNPSPVEEPPVAQPPIGDATGGTGRESRSTTPDTPELPPTKRTSKQKGRSRKKKPKSNDDK